MYSALPNTNSFIVELSTDSIFYTPSLDVVYCKDVMVGEVVMPLERNN